IVRFHWKLATGAVIALAHDVIITAGLFSLFQWPFDLTVLAALLAILGYSINDTVVIFDRQRENYRRMRKADTFTVMNTSINETLARTVMTATTTSLAVVALLLFAGDSVHWFALAMLIGTVIGTYSSVYIASAIGLHLHVTKEDIYPPKEEDAERDARITR
ncbi:MAG TPA: protein translocase subunit SecF, partial [Salinisphaeraceae bacterium]|nr:protein translocase subunit SecF [Salinisphaeraceae bacterium]